VTRCHDLIISPVEKCDKPRVLVCPLILNPFELEESKFTIPVQVNSIPTESKAARLPP
jgi:hypothetical protein